MMTKAETALLVQKAQAGDRQAFEALYNEYRGKVYFFVRRFTGSGDAAEDLTSETFTAAMEGISELRSGESFAGWLYSIAYNKCAQFLKDESRSINVNTAAELEELIEAAALNEPILLPEDYAVNAETRAQLREVIDGLSPDMRSAVIMYYYDEMSIPEVAAAMGTNENNVSQKLHRARKRIRSKIEKLIGRGTLFGAAPMGTLLENLSDSGMDMSTAGIGLAAISAAAVAVPYGLSKVSGGIAGELWFITRKYWSRHKKSLAALLFSGVLLCAVLCCIFLNMRQGFIRGIDDGYDTNGAFSLMIPDTYSDAVELFSGEDTLRGELHVLGTAGIGSRQLHLGTIDDPENLAHFPVSEGRLPEAEGELAAYRSALESLGFFGSVGDRITLDRGTFTLVGILDDGEYEYRVGTDNYLSQVYGSDIFGNSEDGEGERFEYVVPMLYIGGDHSSEALYSWVMLDNISGISYPDKNVDSLEYFEDGFIEALGKNGIHFEEEAYQYKNKPLEALYDYRNAFKQSVRKMMLLYVVSAMIAALSVVAVMRSVFAERESTVSMLKKVGLSRRQIRVMYAVEYIFTALIQTLLGIALGTLAHLGIYLFQTRVLDMKHISGFTDNTYADWLCPKPFAVGAAVSAAVLLAGYVFAALLSAASAHRRSRRKAASLGRSIARAVRTRAVTIIQTAALTLICFGTVYGYMIFHNSQGMYNPNTGEFDMLIDTSFGAQGQFDFEEDGAEEYYYAVQGPTLSNDAMTFAVASNRANGIGDSDADALGDTIAKGSVPFTFAAGSDDLKLNGKVIFPSEEARDFIIENSSEEGRKLLRSGRSLYMLPTVLTNRAVLEKLSEYAVSGEINADRLASGEEVLLAVNSGEPPLTAGDKLTVGGAYTSNGFGIDKLVLSDVRIGAVLVIPPEADRLLRYAVSDERSLSLVTTAQGAAAMGFENAAYNELIAFEKIGSRLPLGTGFTLKSYDQQRREIFIRNASLYGSMAALVLLMSLLGFAAYFNGIGLKIRLREYQLSIMRAVGTPLSRLRRRLTLDSVRIPVLASAAAFGLVKLLQRVILSGFNKAEELMNDAGKAYDTMMSVTDTAEQNRLEELIDSMQQQSTALHKEYLTETQLWYSDAVLPTLIIFAVMCMITVLLTHKGFRRFTPDIAGALARGRKRQ